MKTSLLKFGKLILFTTCVFFNAFNSNAQNISSVAGTGVIGFSGDGGLATGAQIYSLYGQLAKDASGNIYIADAYNHRVRKINITTGIITTIAGTGVAGFFGDGGAATSARLNYPFGVAVDAAGNVYISEYLNNRIRKVTTGGIISTVCGNGAASSTGDLGSPSIATINNPGHICFDGTGKLYVTEYTGNRIRRIDFTANVITTYCGTGALSNTGNGGLATVATCFNPFAIASDLSNNIYFSSFNVSSSGAQVRKIATSGIITRFAGTGAPGYSGDGGLATSAQIQNVIGISSNDAGEIFIGDRNNNRVRKISTSGNISTYAGNGINGFSGDGGVATAAQVGVPDGLVNFGCRLYINSNGGSKLRRVDGTFTISVTSGSICSGSSYTIVPSGALSYTYAGGSAIVTPTVTKTFTVVGSDIAGCVSSIATSTVTVSTTPTITVNSGTICSGNSFTINPSGALSYTYQGGSNIVSPSSSTTYTVIGSNGSCLSNIVTSSVTVNTTPTITVNSGTICIGQTFTMMPSGASSYTYQGGSATVSPGVTSTYTVRGSNAFGCISTAVTSTVTIGNPTITVNSGTICLGQTFTMNPSGAVSYTFQGGSATVSPGVTTTYTVRGSSSGGCVSAPVTCTVVVSGAAIPTVAVNSGSICSGNSFTMTPSGLGIISYTFQGGSAIVTPPSSTTYTVIGRNAAGCVSSPVTSTVTVNTTPTITVNSGSICLGQSFTMTPSGASSYTFQGGSAIVSPTVTKTYTVVGSSAAGCVSSIVTSTVTISPNPTITVNSGTICAGQSFTMNPSGAISYTFQGGSAIVSPASLSTYTVIGSNATGCVSSVVTSTVTVIANPTITVNSGTICSGNSFTMNPSGALSYTYQGGSAIVSPMSNSTYTVIGSNASGCISSIVTSTVTVNTTPTITVSSGTICSGQSFTMNPSGAVSYTYSSGSAVVSPTITTAYSIIGSSAAGCVSGTAFCTVTVNTTPTITVNSGTICSGNSFTMNPSGAVSYTYEGGSAIVSPTISSTYTVIGSSGAGCVSSAVTSSLTVNTTPTITVNSGSICAGQSFTMNPSGASSYTYEGGSAVVSPTINSTYTVTGTSAAGCVSSVVTSSVTVFSIPTLTVNNGSICSGQSFTMNPTGAISYTYSGGSAVVSPFVSTNYTITGSNASGCTNTVVSIVNVSPSPTITAIATPSAICAGEVVTISVTGASSYLWNDGTTSSVITNTFYTSAFYSVVGTDDNGCRDTANVNVNVSQCTGLASQNFNTELLLYPNPNRGEFTVSLANGLEKTIEVLNVTGVVVLKLSSTEDKTHVNIHQLASGIYFVKITSDKSTKIIKIINE